MMADPYGRGLPTAKPARAEVKVNRTVEELRCLRCKKLLAELVTAPWKFTCPRCSHINEARADSGTV